MPLPVADVLKITDGLGAATSGLGVYIPLPCMPYKYQLNTAAAQIALAGLKGPDGATALLTEDMIQTITNAADAVLDVNEYAASERRELDACAKEFARLMTGSTIPDIPVRPTAPTKPVGVQYSYVNDGG